MDAFTFAMRIPWLMEASAYDGLLEIAARAHDPGVLDTVRAAREANPELVASRNGTPLPGGRKATVRDGIATIPVFGPIFRHASMFDNISALSSVDGISKDLTAALGNPDVRGIILHVDSPGGEANGIDEVADMIRSASAIKPVKAYVGGVAQSAGAWIAMAAPEVVVGRLARVGSIGAVMGYTDTKGLQEKTGVIRGEIVSTQSPDKRVDPTTKEGREKCQALVDRLGGEFVTAVARYRSTTEEKVLSDFGKGGTFVGADVIRAGMADRLGSYEGLHKEMASAAAAGTSRIAASGDQDMTFRERFLSLMGQLAEVPDEPVATAPPTAPSPEPEPPVAGPPVPPSPESAGPELATALAKLQAYEERERKALDAEAEAFAQSLFTSGRISGEVRPKAKAQYLRAAALGVEALDDLKALMNSKPTVALTSEILASETTKRVTVDDKAPSLADLTVAAANAVHKQS